MDETKGLMFLTVYAHMFCVAKGGGHSFVMLHKYTQSTSVFHQQDHDCIV